MALGLASYSATAFTIGTQSTNPTVTSPSFSPAAGDVIYVCCENDDSGNTQMSGNTPTNTGTALTWTLVKRDNIVTQAILSGCVEVWRAYNANAQTNITVTWNLTSAQSSHACIAVLGFTGADPNQSGAATQNRNSTASSTTITTSNITTTQIGSWVWAQGSSFTSFTTATPGGGMNTQCPAQNPGNGDTIWTQKENPQPSSSRAAGTSVTVTCTMGATQTAYMVAWEVIPLEIIEDSSAPAAVTSTTTSVTTASFTPAANSLLIAVATCGNNTGSGTVTAPVTDSLSSSWTLLKRANGSGNGSTEIWALDAGASPAARTVTVTGTGGANAIGVALCVKVLRNAAPAASCLGAFTVTGTTTAYTINITPATLGSLLAGGLVDIVASGALTLNGVTTSWQSVSDTTDTEKYGAFRATALTTSLSQATLGYTNTAGDNQSIVAVEILPAPTQAAAQAPFYPTQPSRTWKRRYRNYRTPAISPAVSPDLTINAPPVEATGVAPQPVVEIDLPQTAPQATGTTPQAIPNIKPAIVGVPTATGTAPSAIPAPSALAGIPTATGADPAVPNVQVLAGIPTATGTAPAPTVITGLIINAPVPVATGTAPQPVVSEALTAGIPTATGTAPAPVVSESLTPGIPQATGVASGSTPSISVLSGIPVATGSAPAPGILTGLVVNAPAVEATGVAPQAIANIKPLGGTPTATGGAAAVAGPSVLAGVPTATGGAAAVANVRPTPGIPVATGGAAAVTSIAVLAVVPVATGVAPIPGIITGLIINAPVPVATGVASQPVVSVAVFAIVATAIGVAPATSRGVGATAPAATGSAPQPTAAPSVFALVAVATGAVGDAHAFSVLPHVTARSFSSVTQKATSTSGVTDPREAAALVGTTRTGGTSVADPRDGGTSVTDPRDGTTTVT